MGEDPGTGEDLAGDAEEGEHADLLDENDPQLLLYNSLRNEIHTRIAHHHRSLLSGLSIIGVIIAYALLSGEFVFLAVIPVVVGFLAIQAVRHLNNLFYISRHLSRIERAYVDEYPLFNWELRHGGATTERRIVRWGINWSIVPQVIVIILATLGYVGTIYVAYVVWPPNGIDILVIGLTRGGLLGIYALLTVLICLAGCSYFVHQNELASRDL